MREHAGQIRVHKALAERTGRATYMNKGGTAERIGPCQEGLVAPAVFII